MKIRVLIAEDDADLGQLLYKYMEINGFEPTRVFNGKEARKTLNSQKFDIAVIDVMMPEEDGIHLARELRRLNPDLPFVFLTAKKSREDILNGLKLGADDYITKPFDADELILRINNIVRRSGRKTSMNVQDVEYQIGNYLFRPSQLHLFHPDKVQTLTSMEADLLLYLFEHKGGLVKRDDILKDLWKENDFFKGRSMDVFITRLRKYLGADKGISIESVRGVGYRFLVST